MIEINLIPDVKQEFIHAQRLRAKVISVSILGMLGAVALVVILGGLLGAEAVRNAVADSSITSEYKKMQANTDLKDVVTIQNQLINIPILDQSKTMSSRLFDALSAINPQAPNSVKMTNVVLDPTAKTISIDGTAANSYTATDALKKTILNATIAYTEDSATSTIPLTTDVMLGDTSYGEDSSGNKVLRFKMTFTYPDQLFSNKVTNVSVVTPTGTIDVTDSKTRVPDSLFTSPASDVKSGGTN